MAYSPQPFLEKTNMNTHDPWLLRLSNLSCLTSNDIPTLIQLLNTYSIKKLAALVITGVGVQGKIDEYLDSLITVRSLMSSFQLKPEQLMILPSQQDHQNLINFSSSFHMPWSGIQFSPAKVVTLGFSCYELIGTATSSLRMEVQEVPPFTGNQPCKRIFVTQDPVENWRIERMDHEPQHRSHTPKTCSLQVLEYKPSKGPDSFKVRFSWI